MLASETYTHTYRTIIFTYKTMKTFTNLVCLFSIFLTFSVTNGLLDNDLLLDPFDEVLDVMKIKTKGISLVMLDNMIVKLFGRFRCTAAGNGCKNALCLSAQEIFNVLAVTEGKDLLEDDFKKVSVILMFHLLDLPKYCHQTVAINQNYDIYRSQLQTRLFHGSALQVAFLKQFMDNLNRELDNDDHDDDNHHGKNIHHNKIKTWKNDIFGSDLLQAAKNDDHDDDHDDDDDHDTKVKKTTFKVNDDDDDDHNDSKDHDDDDKDHDDDDDDDNDDDDDDDHDDDDFPKVFKKKCVSANTIFDELGHDPEDILEDGDLDNMAALLIYHLVAGARIKTDCRTLPRKSNFAKALMNYLDAVDDIISFDAFENLMEKLGLDEMKDRAENLADHIDDHLDDHGHRRRRRRRDISEKGDNITKAKIMEIAPALISQQLSGTCGKGRRPSGLTSDAERFGYGTLAVLLICFCSVIGALVIPCANKKIYDVLLAIFIGLAAFGIHAHDGVHDHSGAPDHVWYAFAAFLGIYAFYLLETVMHLLKGNEVRHFEWGHTHSYGFELDAPKNVSNGNGTQDNYLGNSKSTLYDGDPNAHNTANNRLEGTSMKNHGNMTLAVMVVVGDAIHNFADGLAIGAAFTQSSVIGLSTSITVFCHELPHELGDFAILLSTGIGIKKALMANFLSSLTALLGLYIGLGVATDETVRQWIFAIAAGMFIYIALVDMMPELIRGFHSKNRKQTIILNNTGIIVGLIIMMLLSIFEGKMMNM
ncbi:hypothetical protein KUTeg_015316 [Tegillarca granosa]|uniref:Uncharacterized protein n=1 Tax=Tegillarca granosa TaxID=220873 RepID=A0ABQ9ETD5_TEGGR|nr:hypothetical protein KUTeg_015316 [Tegillarca granosa]